MSLINTLTALATTAAMMFVAASQSTTTRTTTNPWALRAIARGAR